MGRLTLHCLLVSISLVECSMVNIIWLTLQRFLVSSSLMGSNTLTALLLVSWATVTRPATRGGGKGESRAWMAKADIEGHVDTAISCGEVERGIATSRPH